MRFIIHFVTGLFLLVFILLSNVALAKPPTEVGIGLYVEQITEINQKAENFGVVATLRMKWQQKELAYTLGVTQETYRLYTLNSIIKLMEEKNLPWPAVSFVNQQGRTDIESQTVKVMPDGMVYYQDRVSATFQAPEFDFRRFPMDHQTFYIIVDSILPESHFIFSEMPEYTGMGNQLGEEEWIITNVQTQISSQNQSGFAHGSRFKLTVEGERHLNYYVFRILIPVLLIITVSWFTFFLQDYMKRIDIGGTNLLIFIAFNFTISSDIPRLGYVTLMDTFMLGNFIVTSMIILVNVIFRRLENHGKQSLVKRMDVYAIVLYPLLYIISGISLLMYFL